MQWSACEHCETEVEGAASKMLSREQKLGTKLLTQEKRAISVGALARGDS